MNEVRGYHSCGVHPGRIDTWYTPLKHSRAYVDYLNSTERYEYEQSKQPVQFKNNDHHGKISKVAGKKINRAVNYITKIVPKKFHHHPFYGCSGEFLLNFITLTLSSEQIHTDNDIKSHLLEPFLDACRRKWKVCSYFWRAEKQKNGSIHFHLITDRFIPWNELRNVWNAQQQKLGYVTRYRDNQTAWHREGFKYRPELEKTWSRVEQFKAYLSGVLHDWANPNSTDVHKICHIINIAAYLVKEVTKQVQTENIQGRLWGCSQNLTNLTGGVGFCEGAVQDEIALLAQQSGSHTYKSDYFSCLFYNYKILYSGKFPLLLSLLEEFVHKRFPAYRPPGLFYRIAT